MSGCHHSDWVEASGTSPLRIVDTHCLERAMGDAPPGLTQYPQVIFFIGRAGKDQAMRALYPFHRDGVPGLARVQCDKSWDNPIVVVDSEPDGPMPTNAPLESCHANSIHDARWGLGGQDPRALFFGRLFFSFSNVVIIFADDLGGLASVAGCLERWCALGVGTTLPESARPRLTVFTSGPCDAAAQLQEEDFYAALHNAAVDQHFASVRVARLAPPRPSTAYPWLRTALRDEIRKARASRTRERLLFTARHLCWFFSQAVRHMAKTLTEPFDFVATSRLGRLPRGDFSQHLGTFFELAGRGRIPSQSVTRLVGSWVVFDAYAPADHGFAPESLYFRYYSEAIRRALNKLFVPETPPDGGTERSGVVDHFEREICAAIRELVHQLHARKTPAYIRHRRTLYDHASALRSVTAQRSNTSCLVCLMNAPEHVLVCDHSLCDACVVRLGRAYQMREWCYRVSCPICAPLDDDMAPTLLVSLKPPTAGVRVAAFDGGGARAIIELEYLQRIERRMGHACDVRDLFDVVFGTSAGGINVLGLYGKGWDVSKCKSEFIRFARQIFGTVTDGTRSLLTSMRSYVRFLVSDNFCDAATMDIALQSSLGLKTQLFGHRPNGHSGIKLGVTMVDMTGVRDGNRAPSLCILTNYNGSRRFPNERTSSSMLSYQHVRSEHMTHETCLWEAGRATSAVPFLFSPAVLPHSSLCVDGGLQVINPTKIAVRETQQIWATATPLDVVISLGTGETDQKTDTIIAEEVSWLSHVARNRSFVWMTRWALQRIRNFIDPEVVHREMLELFETDADNVGTYHRLNVFVHEIARMDDADSIEVLLPSVASADRQTPDTVFRAVFALLASSFFLELEKKPKVNPSLNAFPCVGFVRIRGWPEKVLAGLINFHAGECLLRVETATITEIPISKFDLCPSCKRFNKRVTFDVSSLTAEVKIWLVLRNGAWSRERRISGFPKPAAWFVEQQRLDFLPSDATEASTCACRN